MTATILPFRKRAEPDIEPRRITGEAVDGAVCLEFPSPTERLKLTPEQAEIWVRLLPQLIATARAQRAEAEKWPGDSR